MKLLCLVFLLICLSKIVKSDDNFCSEFIEMKKKCSSSVQPNLKSMTYLNVVPTWYGIEVAKFFGQYTCYDVIILAFWQSIPVPLGSVQGLKEDKGDRDTVKMYNNLRYYTDSDLYGTTTEEIQKHIKKQFDCTGKKLFISAFGDGDFPTSEKKDPIKVAQDLATFANSLQYIDGVDIDYEDNAAVNNGSAVDWLIKFQTELRSKLNKKLLITHAPQGPYFDCEHYRTRAYNTFKNGAYCDVHKAVGNTIDWYNIQYYNQESTKYDDYEGLFKESRGVFLNTAIYQLHNQLKIPFKQIVIGKPSLYRYAYNTGYTKPRLLGQMIKQSLDESPNNLIQGYFIWQIPNKIFTKQSEICFKQRRIEKKECEINPSDDIIPQIKTPEGFQTLIKYQNKYDYKVRKGLKGLKSQKSQKLNKIDGKCIQQ